MTTPQWDTHDMHLENLRDFIDNLVLLKLDSVNNEVDRLSERVTTIEKNEELWENSIYQIVVPKDERQRRTKVKRTNGIIAKDTMRECQKIINRTLEILTDWSKIQDIKLQIQYAAVITGKIDNLKKTDYIQSDDIRKKICTLLRNVIRINVTDVVFSVEQISLLKKGFLLLLSEKIQKKDMLQLNREFLEQQLMTMPAWE